MKMLFERIGRLLQELDERRYPQEVPVEKERPTAMRKMIAGRKSWNAPAEPSINWEIKIFAPSESVMVFSVHAQQRIIMAGTMALKPFGRASMHFPKLSTRRAI